MNEMQLLRNYHDARPGPSPEVVVHARARLEERAQVNPSRPPVRSRARWRKYALGAAVCCAAVAVVPLAAIGGGNQGDQAYAAESLPDGRIKVTLRDLNAPPEVVQRRLNKLERRLGAMGVDADLDFIPLTYRCSVFPRGVSYPGDNIAPPPVTGADRGGDDAIIYIHPDRIKPGRTLVMTLSTNVQENVVAVGMSQYVVRGPAKPCNPVPEN